MGPVCPEPVGRVAPRLATVQQPLSVFPMAKTALATDRRSLDCLGWDFGASKFILDERRSIRTAFLS